MTLYKTILSSILFGYLVNCSPRVEPLISAGELLDQTISALGGEKAVANLKGVTYHSPK
jgi:hypothetical protein